MVYKALLIFSALIYLCQSAFEFSELGVQKCRLEDSKCMRGAFQAALPRFLKGIPEYGVEVMDEMIIDNVKFKISDLEFILTNGRVIGFKDIIIDTIKFDKNNTWETAYHVPFFILRGNYRTSGKLFTLPIEGDGDIEIKLENTVVRSKLNCEIMKKNNKSYMAIKTTYYEYDIGNAQYYLTNLFKGNKELSDTMLKLINENSKELIVEFGKPIMDKVAKKTFRNVKNFFAKSPLEDIAIVD